MSKLDDLIAQVETHPGYSNNWLIGMGLCAVALAIIEAFKKDTK